MCADSAVRPGRAPLAVSRERLSNDSSAGASSSVCSCSRVQLCTGASNATLPLPPPPTTAPSAGCAASGAASKAVASARSHGKSSCSSASRSSTLRMPKWLSISRSSAGSKRRWAGASADEYLRASGRGAARLWDRRRRRRSALETAVAGVGRRAPKRRGGVHQRRGRARRGERQLVCLRWHEARMRRVRKGLGELQPEVTKAVTLGDLAGGRRGERREGEGEGTRCGPG